MSIREMSFPTRALGDGGYHRILIAGGRELIRDGLRGLDRDDFVLVTETHGHRALERLCTEAFDAAVIDLELPPFDDFSIVPSWQLTDIPMIAITSKVDAADAIAALEMGADDYVRKQYLIADLCVRLCALLKRTSHSDLRRVESTIISLGGLAIDPATFQVWKEGRDVGLSMTEYKLLFALVREGGRPLTREALVQKAWGYNFLGSSRLVDMTIARLRSKIEEHPKQPQFVLTVRGIGYRFQAPSVNDRSRSLTGR